jgi:hypothetical protein
MRLPTFVQRLRREQETGPPLEELEREELRREAESIRAEFGSLPSREMRRLMVDERTSPMARAERATRMAPPVNATLSPIREDAPTSMREFATGGRGAGRSEGLVEDGFVAGAERDEVVGDDERGSIPRVDDEDAAMALAGIGEDGSDDGPLDYDVPLMRGGP